MNLNALRLFAAVVEHHGFSRAADAVHVSQPAVSKAVRELERKAGVPLLERGGRGVRGVRLTEAGVALYARARRIFSEERAAEEELRAQRGVELGTLRIGASTTIATYLLPELLAAFDRLHPGVELLVASLNTRAVVERLLEYELDVALVEGPVGAAGVEVLPWREDRLVVIAAAAHRLVGRGVEASELARERLLVREPGSGTRAVGEAALGALGVEPARTLELGSTEAIKRAVAAGLGVAIVSRAALDAELELGTLAMLDVEGLEIRRPLSRLSLSGRPPSRAARVFEALLADVA